MRRIRVDGHFDAWRDQARLLLAERVPPEALCWQSREDADDIFAGLASSVAQTSPAAGIRLPRAVLARLQEAARYRAEDRWAFLYRVLWRYLEGDHSVLLPGDVDGSRLEQRIRNVRREAHQMQAFVRFERRAWPDGSEQYVAWYEPRHDVLDLLGEHMSARLGRTSWLIATPDAGLRGVGGAWDYRAPCPEPWRALAQDKSLPEPSGDLWLAYYASTFNPARVNEKLLASHLPRQLWRHLPEGVLIGGLIRQARLGGQRDGQSAAVGARPGRTIPAAPPGKGSSGSAGRCRCPRLPG
ncbi:TIGR03915 family putative DNA repair protein [Stutzerimonas tarimensis]|uniref:TIGR03915 family putative DNA repair protein n=1 Tax=Stutzerimonas tarimensis TaxID=1507735 RepID=A0ABV7T7S2_9GAMM